MREPGCFFQLLITLSPPKLALLDLSPQAVVLAEDAESPSSIGGQHQAVPALGNMAACAPLVLGVDPVLVC